MAESRPDRSWLIPDWEGAADHSLVPVCTMSTSTMYEAAGVAGHGA